ncbi:MAG: hypothetical protein L0211_17910 [Planctomycetaceae bacterium]|nr:hypothetical protein [Planctomycetaceae bacterium]
MLTPEFLLWSLEYRCPLRALEDGSDPERTERQLRASRAVSDARHEGRVFEGIAVDPPNGFRIDDALAIYGGEEAARRACSDCPANALAGDDHPLFRGGPAQTSPQLAGCYGLVRLPDEPARVHLAIEQGIAKAYGSNPWEDLGSATTPRWYGLWLDSPLDSEHLLVRYNVLAAAPIDDAACRRGIADLLVALNVAFNAGLRLHVRLYPPGRVEGTSWRLVPHCPRCQGPWTASGNRCAVCGYVGHPAPDKKRRARGTRPYYPLDRLLGGALQAAHFMSRYDSLRARERPPGQPPVPLPPAPRNSRPGD